MSLRKAFNQTETSKRKLIWCALRRSTHQYKKGTTIKYKVSEPRLLNSRAKAVVSGPCRCEAAMTTEVANKQVRP